MFERVDAVLRAHGLLLDKGTVVDATIISAPSSTKNQAKTRDPDMQQTRKGNQWYFAMKAHIGADLHRGAAHSLTCTAANITQTAHLLHGREKRAYADAGYIGAAKRAELKDRDRDWHFAEKRGKLAAMDEGALKEHARQTERLEAQIRSRVDHTFHVVKKLFGHRKARYRELKENTTHLDILLTLANLYLLRRPLMA